MLLWEIAEEKLPYSDVEDIIKVRELACDKYYREPLSPNTPAQYQSIVIQGVNIACAEIFFPCLYKRAHFLYCFTFYHVSHSVFPFSHPFCPTIIFGFFCYSNDVPRLGTSDNYENIYIPSFASQSACSSSITSPLLGHSPFARSPFALCFSTLQFR